MLEKIKNLLLKESNLKAREIATRLGFGRAAVSKLLHDKKDTIFNQNENFQWSLVGSGQVVVEFEAKWIDCRSFESSLSNSELNVNEVQKVKFVLPKNCKFLLESAGRFLALSNQLIDQGKNVTLDLTECMSSLHYLNRAGFFDQLNQDVEILPKRPKSSTAKSYKGNSVSLLEFGSVDLKGNNDELVQGLTDTFVKRSGDNYRDPAGTIFAELIDNVKNHSDSKLLGFAALQDYNGFAGSPRHIQTIVSDSGVGIASTLRPVLDGHYPELKDLSDIELVKSVLSKGEISKHGAKSGHGLGFKSSKEKAVKFNARYSVRQKNFSLEFQFQNGKLQPVKAIDGLVDIAGTHICFDFIC